MVSMSSSYTIFPLYLFTVVIVSSDAFLQGQSLPETVDRWLHWGANIHDTQKVPPAPHPRAALPWGDKSSSEVPSYIIGAAMSNHTSHFPPDYSQQMMHRAEVDLIASYLRPTDVYLEYGSGGSTINFVPLVARAYSVEHNCEWTNFMSSSLKAHPRANLYSNLHFHCISMVPGFRGWGTLSSYEHANYVQFREYVNAIDSFSETTFDRVFIDGRARLACALKVLPYLKPDSLVFIHDFYARTKQYGAVLRYYVEVARVLAVRNHDASQGPIDEPQGLIILRRADNLTANNSVLKPHEIDAIYKSINWREPFGPPLTNLHGYISYAMSTLDFGTWSRARSPRALVRLVRNDILRAIAVYAIISIVIFAYRRCMTPLVKEKDETINRRNATNSSEPRFIETEAMKAASARRKKVSASSSQLRV